MRLIVTPTFCQKTSLESPEAHSGSHMLASREMSGHREGCKGTPTPVSLVPQGEWLLPGQAAVVTHHQLCTSCLFP